MSASNVKLICPKCKKPPRIGYRLISGGREKKVRACKKCGQERNNSSHSWGDWENMVKVELIRRNYDFLVLENNFRFYQTRKCLICKLEDVHFII